MKTKPTLYLSGKITGLPRWIVLAKFKIFTLFFKLCGFNVWSPIEHVDKKTPWGMAMDICLPAMQKCDFIYFMFDWRWSRGARIEFYAGAHMGLHIVNLNQRLRRKYEANFVSRYQFKPQKIAV